MQQLPFAHKQDFEDARAGFVAPLPDQGVIRNKAGQAVWDLSRYSFIKPDAAAPDTVNPSLWRQSQILLIAGLFKVTERPITNCRGERKVRPDEKYTFAGIETG